MLDPCSSQTVFCTCEPRLTSPVLNRIGLGWWHSFVWLDGGPSKASLIPSQKGSPSTAPTCTEIRSQVITARLRRLAAQCELRDRITLGEVQASASICCSCCKAVTQSWFTCARLKHRHSVASMWNRSRNVLPQLFSVRRFYPVLTLKRN